jgi:hypothetical protein
MIALGIESGGKRQYMGGAKLHTEAATLAALDGNANGAFGHRWSEST